MNPLTNVKNITKLNEREIALGTKGSWHDQYKDSAWVFIGGLPYDLTEGDIICVFSQFGEIVNVNLIRDKKSGKTKGFCFLCYENQKSTVLAVDNLNGIKILGRTIRVDHVANYKPPKEREDDDEITKSLYLEGCAPKVPIESPEPEEIKPKTDEKKDKKKKKSKGRKKRKRKKSSSPSRSDSSSSEEEKLDIKIKEEKLSPEYNKYDTINRVIGPVRSPTAAKNENTPQYQGQRDSFEPRDRERNNTRREWPKEIQFRRNHNSRDISIENARDESRDRRNQNSFERSAERRNHHSRERSRESSNINTRDQSRETMRVFASYSDRTPQSYKLKNINRNSRDRSRERRHNDNGRGKYKDDRR